MEGPRSDILTVIIGSLTFTATLVLSELGLRLVLGLVVFCRWCWSVRCGRHAPRPTAEGDREWRQSSKLLTYHLEHPRHGAPDWEAAVASLRAELRHKLNLASSMHFLAAHALLAAAVTADPQATPTTKSSALPSSSSSSSPSPSPSSHFVSSPPSPISSLLSPPSSRYNMPGRFPSPERQSRRSEADVLEAGVSSSVELPRAEDSTLGSSPER